MTAVVGILNKQAVALAADSAVTIGGANGRKIFNKANKVFTLSKHHPVGIMIYNSASFMETPWETIIKVYRKQLGEKSFPTLKEYQEDFIQFIRSKNFYTSPDLQLSFLQNFALDIINSIINEIADQNRVLIHTPSEENRQQFLFYFEKKIDELIFNWIKSPNICSDYEDYTFEHFNAYSQQIFEDIDKFHFTANEIKITKPLNHKIKELVYLILKNKEEFFSYTGLIFSGFGEEEIYPQLIPLNVSMVIDNRLKYHITEHRIVSISNDNNGAICPFAQTDVINTILTGIDPSLDNIYLNNFEALFKKYNQEILSRIGSSNPLLSTQIQQLDIDPIVKTFNEMNQLIKRENYISPLMSAVSTLSKEDLAEMAESLIYLTYLKRRMTFAEESVGGPVDVAVISKGDGFIWIKRKHYFNPELNKQFFDNYFKK